jgi:tetratricopeptide (TPR) repeat protein
MRERTSIDERVAQRPRPGGVLSRVAIGLIGFLMLAACQSSPPPGLVEQGDAAWASGNYAEADALYASALKNDPSSPAALLGRARIAVQLGDPERALGYHGAIANSDRGFWQANAHTDYALTLFEVGRARLAAAHPDGAVAALRALQHIDPERPGLRDLLARALTARAEQLSMRGDRETALALFQEAISIDSRSVAAYVGAAEILIGSGQKQEAMVLLESARRTDPADNRVRALTMEAMGLY